MVSFNDWCQRENEIEDEFYGYSNEEVCTEWGASLYQWIVSQSYDSGVFDVKLTEEEFIDRFIRLIYKFQ